MKRLAKPVTAAQEYPEDYFDEYFGKTQYEKYGDMISEKLSGKIISKRIADGDNPGGLPYEAKALGLDMWDLLKALEGMCHNGTAREISDYQYRVL